MALVVVMPPLNCLYLFEATTPRFQTFEPFVRSFVGFVWLVGCFLLLLVGLVVLCLFVCFFLFIVLVRPVGCFCSICLFFCFVKLFVYLVVYLFVFVDLFVLINRF